MTAALTLFDAATASPEPSPAPTPHPEPQRAPEGLLGASQGKPAATRRSGGHRPRRSTTATGGRGGTALGPPRPVTRGPGQRNKRTATQNRPPGAPESHSPDPGWGMGAGTST